MTADAAVQKGEGSAAVEARRKELAAARASSGPRAAKQFYRVTVRVRAGPFLQPVTYATNPQFWLVLS